MFACGAAVPGFSVGVCEDDGGKGQLVVYWYGCWACQLVFSELVMLLFS